MSAHLATARYGDGDPVVLVHGSSGGLDSWDGVIPFLAGSFTTWVYARRGYSPSDIGPQEKTFDDDVADLIAVIQQAGGTAHVVGASYGALVGLHTAIRRPEVLRSLTVFEPPLFAAGPASAGVFDVYRDLVAAGDLAAAARVFAERVARVPDAILDAMPAHNTDSSAVSEAVGCVRDVHALASDVANLDRWGSIDVPVQLMQGSDSWEPIPKTMDALAEVLPHRRRVVLDGHSHFATHTAPELFAQHVVQFVNG